MIPIVDSRLLFLRSVHCNKPNSHTQPHTSTTSNTGPNTIPQCTRGKHTLQHKARHLHTQTINSTNGINSNSSMIDSQCLGNQLTQRNQHLPLVESWPIVDFPDGVSILYPTQDQTPYRNAHVAHTRSSTRLNIYTLKQSTQPTESTQTVPWLIASGEEINPTNGINTGP